jgi:hypothetical protein
MYVSFESATEVQQVHAPQHVHVHSDFVHQQHLQQQAANTQTAVKVLPARPQ